MEWERKCEQRVPAVLVLLKDVSEHKMEDKRNKIQRNTKKDHVL